MSADGESEVFAARALRDANERHIGRRAPLTLGLAARDRVARDERSVRSRLFRKQAKLPKAFAPRYASIVTVRDQPTQVAETIAARMAVYLGPHTARIAVKTFSQRALGRGPDSLELPDVPELLAALRPMLRTLVGHSQCEIVLQRIERELGL